MNVPLPFPTLVDMWQVREILAVMKQLKQLQMKPFFLGYFFLRFICNCLSYFITTRIPFTCILYPQCTHRIFIIYTPCLVDMLQVCSELINENKSKYPNARPATSDVACTSGKVRHCSCALAIKNLPGSSPPVLHDIPHK